MRRRARTVSSGARRRVIVALGAGLLALGGCHRSYWFGGKSLGPAQWVQRPCDSLPAADSTWREVGFQGALLRVPADFRLHQGEGGRSIWLERPGDRIVASLTSDHEADRSLGQYSGKFGRCELQLGPRLADLVAYASPEGEFVSTVLWPDINRTYSLRVTVSSNRPLAGDSLRSVLASVRFPNDSTIFRRP